MKKWIKACLFSLSISYESGGHGLVILIQVSLLSLARMKGYEAVWRWATWKYHQVRPFGDHSDASMWWHFCSIVPLSICSTGHLAIVRSVPGLLHENDVKVTWKISGKAHQSSGFHKPVCWVLCPTYNHKTKWNKNKKKPTPLAEYFDSFSFT